jgi:Lysine methyltransferase
MTSKQNPIRSKARWEILRSALLGIEFSENARDASIHRYQGYQLLRKERVVSIPEASRDLICSGDNPILEFLAQQCHYGDEGSVIVKFSNSLDRKEIINIREELGRRGILAKFDDETCVAHIQWSFSAFMATRYTVCDYVNLYIRERKPKKRISLKELQSHDRHCGVDNTGQTCVWDSECTLAYCLGRKDSALIESLPILSELSTNHVIMELGSGMAGIAGLLMAKISPARVILTDGHPESVENNKVNVCMNKLSDQVLCEKLLWTANITAHRETADVVFCSDCTHFEEHHTGLVITLAHILKVGGSAILCQPPRAESLHRFLSLCRLRSSMWNITYVEEPIIERKHNESVQDPFYDPNIHRPCIILLQKLTAFQDEDRISINLHSTKIF